MKKNEKETKKEKGMKKKRKKKGTKRGCGRKSKEEGGRGRKSKEEEGRSHDVRLRWCTRVPPPPLRFQIPSEFLQTFIGFSNIGLVFLILLVFSNLFPQFLVFSPHPFGFRPFCLSPFLRVLSPSPLPPLWLLPLSVCFSLPLWVFSTALVFPASL